ncbi:MAG TPA: hypothetical protein PKL99_02260, partial [Syntrophales bacterium]|nr:hypothetical protein [Syntrophales bacterium]
MKWPVWRCCFAYFLFLSLFFFSVICPAGALADAGSSPGPRVIAVGGASLPDGGSPAGTDAGDAVEGETGEAP